MNILFAGSPGILQFFSKEKSLKIKSLLWKELIKVWIRLSKIDTKK